MFQRLQFQEGALGVILISLIFIGCFFLLNFLVPLLLWTKRKLTQTAYSGQEIIEILNDDAIDIKAKKTSWSSPYYKYNKVQKSLTFSKSTLNSRDMNAVFKVLTSFAFANEKQNKMFKFSWQLWILTALSILPYLFGISILLLIYLPDEAVFHNISGMKYYLTAEVLGVVSFVLILIIGIWWTFAIQPLEVEFEEFLKKINNRALHSLILSHYKVCSYVPFAWRLML